MAPALSRPATPMKFTLFEYFCCTAATAPDSLMQVGHHGAQNHKTRSVPAKSPVSREEPSTVSATMSRGQSGAGAAISGESADDAALWTDPVPEEHAADSSVNVAIKAVSERKSRMVVGGHLSVPAAHPGGGKAALRQTGGPLPHGPTP